MTGRRGPRVLVAEPRTSSGLALDEHARQDISGRTDVMALLTDFYGRCFDDELLRPVFVDIAHLDLPAHLPAMCDFWETVLFRTGAYRRNALKPHQRLDERAHLTPAHFGRWLTLWCATVDDRHAGGKADLAKVQASRIAGAMCRRITNSDVCGGPPAIADPVVTANPTAAGLRRRSAPIPTVDPRPVRPARR